jgi:hypothetical protein
VSEECHANSGRLDDFPDLVKVLPKMTKPMRITQKTTVAVALLDRDNTLAPAIEHCRRSERLC